MRRRGEASEDGSKGSDIPEISFFCAGRGDKMPRACAELTACWPRVCGICVSAAEGALEYASTGILHSMAHESSW